MGSPLAEGRELKCLAKEYFASHGQSPLAEGRELKWWKPLRQLERRRVAPRGGA